jgi:hypothetical protein
LFESVQRRPAGCTKYHYQTLKLLKRFFFTLARQQALDSLCNLVAKPERFVGSDCKVSDAAWVYAWCIGSIRRGLRECTKLSMSTTRSKFGTRNVRDSVVITTMITIATEMLRRLTEANVDTLRKRTGACTDLFAIRALGDDLLWYVSCACAVVRLRCRSTRRSSAHVTDPEAHAERVRLGRAYFQARGLTFVVTDSLLAEATLSDAARQEIEALTGGGDVMTYAQQRSHSLIERFIAGIADLGGDEESDDEAAVDDDDALVAETGNAHDD